MDVDHETLYIYEQENCLWDKTYTEVVLQMKQAKLSSRSNLPANREWLPWSESLLSQPTVVQSVRNAWGDLESVQVGGGVNIWLILQNYWFIMKQDIIVQQYYELVM